MSGLNVPAIGGTLYATDVSQLTNLAQALAGAQEISHYFLGGGCYAANAVVSVSKTTYNQFSSPVSASVATGDVSPAGGMGTVSIGNLQPGNCQIYCSNISGANTNPRAGGQYTIQF